MKLIKTSLSVLFSAWIPLYGDESRRTATIEVIGLVLLVFVIAVILPTVVHAKPKRLKQFGKKLIRFLLLIADIERWLPKLHDYVIGVRETNELLDMWNDLPKAEDDE